MTIVNLNCIYCKNKDLKVIQMNFSGINQIEFLVKCGCCNKMFNVITEVEYKSIYGVPLEEDKEQQEK